MKSIQNRKIIFAVGLLLSFALLVFSLSVYFDLQRPNMRRLRLDNSSMMRLPANETRGFMENIGSPGPPITDVYLLPFIAFIGVLVGTLVYHIMSDKIVQQEKSLEKNTKIILKFLTSDERKVIESLLEAKGKIQQSELSLLPNLNKVKTHRILQKLEQKGIVQKEKLGKVNRIVLDKELYDVLEG